MTEVFNEERAAYFAWKRFDQPYRLKCGLPLTKGEYAKFHNMPLSQIKKWDNSMNSAVNAMKPKIEEEIKEPGVKEIAYNQETFLENRSKEADEALMEACKRGNASALKVYFQLTGRLIEKTENTNIDLGADDYRRIKTEAEQKASDFEAEYEGKGDVLPESSIFRQDVLQDNQSEHSEDN